MRNLTILGLWRHAYGHSRASHITCILQKQDYFHITSLLVAFFIQRPFKWQSNLTWLACGKEPLPSLMFRSQAVLRLPAYDVLPIYFLLPLQFRISLRLQTVHKSACGPLTKSFSQTVSRTLCFCCQAQICAVYFSTMTSLNRRSQSSFQSLPVSLHFYLSLLVDPLLVDVMKLTFLRLILFALK